MPLLLVALCCGLSTGCLGPAKSPRQGAAPRIVSLCVAGDELLWELGPKARDLVVGVSVLADDPSFHRRPGRWPKDIARVETRLEPVLALEPSLVVLADFTSSSLVQKLKDAGIAVLKLQTPSRWAHLSENAALLARTLAIEVPGTLAVPPSLHEPTGANGEATPTRLSWLALDAASFAPGRDTTFALALAGHGAGRLAVDHEGFQRVSTERIYAIDPDRIVIAGESTRSGCLPLPEALSSLGRLRAVTECHMSQIEGALLSTTGPDLVKLADVLAEHAKEHGGTSAP